MRIGLVVPSLGGGGAEVVVANLASEFHRRGIDVCVLAGRASGPAALRIAPGVPIIDLGARHLSMALWRLGRIARQSEFDWIVSALDNANVLSLLARRLFAPKSRCLISIHSTHSQSMKNPNWRARSSRILARILYPAADAEVAVSRDVEQDLRDSRFPHARRLTTILNPVITDRLLEARRTAKPPAALLDSPESPVIVAVGRLVPEKDYPTLIRAMEILRRRVPARLLILGEGPLRAELERLAAGLGLKGSVRFLGHVPDPYPYMRHAATFCMSSVVEGLPTALIEALALGAPVVATDCLSGPAEILAGGLYGKLVPVHDPHRLAEAIEASIAEGPAAVPAHAIERFSTRRAADEYLQLMSE